MFVGFGVCCLFSCLCFVICLVLRLFGFGFVWLVVVGLLDWLAGFCVKALKWICNLWNCFAGVFCNGLRLLVMLQFTLSFNSVATICVSIDVVLLFWFIVTWFGVFVYLIVCLLADSFWLFVKLMLVCFITCCCFVGLLLCCLLWLFALGWDWFKVVVGYVLLLDCALWLFCFVVAVAGWFVVWVVCFVFGCWCLLWFRYCLVDGFAWIWFGLFGWCCLMFVMYCLLVLFVFAWVCLFIVVYYSDFGIVCVLFRFGFCFCLINCGFWQRWVFWLNGWVRYLPLEFRLLLGLVVCYVVLVVCLDVCLICLSLFIVLRCYDLVVVFRVCAGMCLVGYLLNYFGLALAFRFWMRMVVAIGLT